MSIFEGTKTMFSRWIITSLAYGTLIIPATLFAQDNFGGLFRDYVVVQKESAEAKRVRLQWISEERNRIRDELKKFDSELAEIEKIIPRPIQPRTLSKSQSDERQKEQREFKDWAASNDPTLRSAIFRGPALNALLRVLGPIAHTRKIRTNDAPAVGVFSSLSPGNIIDASEWEHYRLNSATTSGSKAEMRLNQMPLRIEWPLVIKQKWKSDCENLDKARDAFIAVLSPGGDDNARIDRAELLDKSLSLLQAKIQKDKAEVLRDRSLDGAKQVKVFCELRDSIQYLQSIRDTVERLKNVPADYKVQRFMGGSIEDFLDYCYLHDLVFLEAKPADKEFYTRIYRRIQDYAHDVQYVEDWRSSVDQRIKELNDDDRKLVWRASEQ